MGFGRVILNIALSFDFLGKLNAFIDSLLDVGWSFYFDLL
jgi:hypothetical protein